MERDENQEMDFTHEAEIADEIVNLSTEKESKPVLKEANSNLPVYKEDNQVIVGGGVPKIKIDDSILKAALKGNKGEWAVEFELVQCEKATDEYINS